MPQFPYLLCVLCEMCNPCRKGTVLELGSAAEAGAFLGEK